MDPHLSSTQTGKPARLLGAVARGIPLQQGEALQLPQGSMTRPLRLLHQRWQRLQIDVRCALRAGEPQRIRHYLFGGGKLARLGVFNEVGVHLHMTRTLLRTARDPELPCHWRSACLECVSQPLQQLRDLLALHDPLAMRAIEQAVASCQHSCLGKECGHGT